MKLLIYANIANGFAIWAALFYTAGVIWGVPGTLIIVAWFLITSVLTSGLTAAIQNQS